MKDKMIRRMYHLFSFVRNFLLDIKKHNVLTIPNFWIVQVASVAVSPVVQFVDSNFQNGIASGTTLVKFYAPW